MSDWLGECKWANYTHLPLVSTLNTVCCLRGAASDSNNLFIGHQNQPANTSRGATPNIKKTFMETLAEPNRILVHGAEDQYIY